MLAGKKDEPRRHKDGYFRSTFYYQGKQYAATSKNSQKEADKKAALKLDKLERGEVGISGKMTVQRWGKEYLETYKKGNVIDKVYSVYTRYLDKIIVPEIGSLRLIDVKDIHLQKLVNSRAGLSESEISKFKNLLQAMFRQARISRLIIYDPAEGLVMPKASNGTNRSITDFEREHILKTAETHYGGLWVKMILYCGLRPGETRALTWRDIDFDKKLVHVKLAMESGSKNIKGPKTSAGVRSIPIPDNYLLELKAARGSELFSYVFTQKKTGNIHTESSMRKLWLSFKKALDIDMGAVYGKKKSEKNGKFYTTCVLSIVADDLKPYCLRHTYCTDLQRAGVPINVAKYLMGHSDISTTASIYTHITDDVIQSAADMINNKDKPEDNANNDAKLSATSD